MEKYARVIREVEESSKKNELRSPRELVEMLMMSRAPGDQQEKALLSQVDVATRQRNRAWKRTLAKEADTLQFTDTDWIDVNIHPVQRRQRAASTMPRGTSPYRDMRLKTDPSLQVVRGDAARPTSTAASMSIVQREPPSSDGASALHPKEKIAQPLQVEPPSTDGASGRSTPSVPPSTDGATATEGGLNRPWRPRRWASWISTSLMRRSVYCSTCPSR